MHKRPGFTLIELLLIVGIIAILASIVIIALNPSKQLINARDEQRLSDLNAILDAVYQYTIDTDELPPDIPVGAAKEICQTGLDCSDIGDAVNLEVLVGPYITIIPVDPSVPADNGTDYFIVLESDGSVTVSAPMSEGEEISVTR